MNAHFDFAGQSVFVAGGTSGINLGIAEAFAAAGARLGVASRSQEKVDAAVARLAAVLSTRDYTLDARGAWIDAESRSPEKIADLMARLSGAHPPLGYAFDVRDAPAAAAALAAFAAEAGPIDVVISGAAGNFPALAADLSPNGFKAVVDIDLLGTFNVMKAAHPHMRRPGGSLINVSAPQAQLPMPFQVHVCAAKAGVEMLTRCLALEWGPEGLRVNAVVPGPIDGTEGMARLAPTADLRARVAASVPLGRFGTPADVAAACLFLASDAAAYVNGAILPADGGWLLNGAPLGR